MKYSKYYLLASSLIATSSSAIISLVPIGSYDQAQVSALYSTLFTPANFTFSIWSVVYLSWIILGIWVALGNIKVSKKNTLLLASAQILSSLWLLPSQSLLITLSFMVMLGVLGLLIVNFLKSRKENTSFRYVVDLFLGWIIIASIANFHQVLVVQGVYKYSISLTIASIILGVFIVLSLLKTYKSLIPSLVALWALVGIIFGQQILLIQQTALLSIMVILGGFIFYYEPKINKFIASKSIKKNKKTKKKKHKK